MELITLPSGGIIVKIPGFITALLSRNPFGDGILFTPYIWFMSLNRKKYLKDCGLLYNKILNKLYFPLTRKINWFISSHNPVN
jgi:hypothetical protein